MTCYGIIWDDDSTYWSKRTQENVTEFTLRLRFMIYKRPSTNQTPTENLRTIEYRILRVNTILHHRENVGLQREYMVNTIFKLFLINIFVIILQ